MFNNFLDPSYWFTLRPAEVGGLSGQMIFGFFVLLFVLGIVGRIVSLQKKDDRYIRDLGQRAGTLLITMGLLGVFFFFFSYERIQLFGSRFWYVFWLIGFVVWAFFLIKFARQTIPQMKERETMRAEKQKYFPPRHKRRR